MAIARAYKAYKNYDCFTYNSVKGESVSQSLLPRALNSANEGTPRSSRYCHTGFGLSGPHSRWYMCETHPTNISGTNRITIKYTMHLRLYFNRSRTDSRELCEIYEYHLTKWPNAILCWRQRFEPAIKRFSKSRMSAVFRSIWRFVTYL
ncbi:hypothetical protein BCR41DRAFT_370118 [Lobosporangium transversale]|uniref:Uncharacterized protein n=1 Tax=Lobosporangium transversale TaxID=64571 RepID=A0A1Y2GS54_9FUNG|nr:hypothetical protein BCR41DRAFT_370118 [Lobosporangium transversale]ORZ18315.1 hypothetical protein BCR41DRAFT_370118 [Lobosporangium transversale]|eukprot:XP_021882110.1 hypothetical protein BCR41DRAFT_370118 [Lobosporangium transversale]